MKPQDPFRVGTTLSNDPSVPDDTGLAVLTQIVKLDNLSQIGTLRLPAGSQIVDIKVDVIIPFGGEIFIYTIINDLIYYYHSKSPIPAGTEGRVPITFYKEDLALMSSLQPDLAGGMTGTIYVWGPGAASGCALVTFMYIQKYQKQLTPKAPERHSAVMLPGAAAIASEGSGVPPAPIPIGGSPAPTIAPTPVPSPFGLPPADTSPGSTPAPTPTPVTPTPAAPTPVPTSPTPASPTPAPVAPTPTPASPTPAPTSRVLDPTFFGVHLAAQTIEGWPTVSFKTQRTWDSYINVITARPGVSWADLNPSNGVYTWDNLDALVSDSVAHGADLIYAFGYVPTWVNGSATNAPSDAAWTNFVTAIVARYGSTIKYWDLWNEPNATTFWTGTTAQMVRLAQIAYPIIKASGGIVLSPSPQGTNAHQWLDDYFSAGGSAYTDVVNFHGYLNGSPELITTLYNNVKTVANNYGLGTKEVWDTEHSWGDDTSPFGQDDNHKQAWLARFITLSASIGIDRSVWYGWEHFDFGTLFDRNTDTLLPAGTAYKTLHGWLNNAEVMPHVVSGNLYTVELKRIGGYSAFILWTINETTQTYSVPAGYTKRYDIDGNVSTITTGQSLTINLRPILVERPTTPTPTIPTPAPTPTPTPVAPTPTPTPTPPNPQPYGQTAALYPSMTFQEEFNGTSLNSANWNTSIWYESPDPTINYSVEGGELLVWPALNSNSLFVDRNFTTDGKFYQKYGYFEIEAKLPIGYGLRPSIYMFNHVGTDRPEIAFLEAYPGAQNNGQSGWSDASNHPLNYVSLVNLPDGTGAGDRKNDVNVDLSAAYHKYGFRWDNTGVTFYFDGVANGTKVSTAGMNEAMFFIIGFMYGGISGDPNAGGSTPPTGKTNSLRINYIRAWSLNDGTTEVTGGSPAPTPVAPTPVAPTPIAPTPATPTPVPTALTRVAFVSSPLVSGTEYDDSSISTVNDTATNKSWTIVIRNQAQNRTGSAPNNWDCPIVRYCRTAWNVCYYAELRTDGISVIKSADNGAGGIIRTTLLNLGGAQYGWPVGEFHTLDIAVSSSGGHTIKRDGVTLGTFVDTSYTGSKPLEFLAVNSALEIQSISGTLNDDFEAVSVGSRALNQSFGIMTFGWNGNAATGTAGVRSMQGVTPVPIPTPAPVAPTPTPAAPTPVATPVAPTPTNGPFATMTEVVNNMTTTTASEAQPINSYWSWQTQTAITQPSPNGASIPSWWTYERPVCTALQGWFVLMQYAGHTATNTRVQMKDLRMFVLLNSTRQWVRVGYENAPNVDLWTMSDPTARFKFKSGTAGERSETTGGYSVKPADPDFHHGYFGSKLDLASLGITPTNVRAVFVAMDFRAIKDNTAGSDDIDSARFCFDVGADWYPDVNTDWSPGWAPGVGNSRMLLATRNWRTAALLVPNTYDYTATFSEMTSNPPPLGSIATAPATPTPTPVPTAPTPTAPTLTYYTRNYSGGLRTWNFDGNKPWINVSTGLPDVQGWIYSNVENAPVTNAGVSPWITKQIVGGVQASRMLIQTTDQQIYNYRTQLSAFRHELYKRYRIETEFMLDPTWDLNMGSTGEGLLFQAKGQPKTGQFSNASNSIWISGTSMYFENLYPYDAMNATSWPTSVQWTNSVGPGGYVAGGRSTPWTITKGVWYNIVIDMFVDDRPPQFGGQGFTKVYVDGSLWVDKTGPNHHPDQLGEHRWDWGWYNWGATPGVPLTSNRMIYFKKANVSLP